MYPIADLTAFCKRTTGDVPPKLVGASTTVVGSKMYLYGGRLVAERRMVSDMYVFDLETYKWEKVQQSSDDDIPQARYFHSADTWNNHLIIFGGMAIQPQSNNPEDLCVLNDVRLFDLISRRWLPASSTTGEASWASPSLVPKARYAHLSSVTANRLFIIGGQDLNNVWLDDIHVYDLVSRRWIQRRDYPRHCGTYRSVAVTAQQRVRFPSEEGRRAQPNLGPPGTRFRTDKNEPPASDVTSPESLVHLPYSALPTEEYPSDIYLFSNYNFTDVQRELEVFSPLPESDFSITDRSSSMTGTSFPPGLRFPTGAILGTNMIIAGTYLSQTFQSFSVWTLDLVSMTWSRIDPGSALVGSWFRSCLWPEANKFLIFGNRHGNLVEDYNRRLLSWDHVAVIDLEAFGIYQPPPLMLDIPMQELGLAALEEGVLADFEIVCDDGRKVMCSRKVLEDRWPWFKEQRRLYVQAAGRALETIPSPNGPTAPLPNLPTVSNPRESLPDSRLTPRSFHLSEPYPITLAFVQYLYTMALVTPLQHAPAVLSQLLLLSSTYDLPHLQSLVKHAMHRALTFSTSVGIYGVSTLCNCRSLQIRALRVVMAYSQKRPQGGRSRNDRDGEGSGGSGGRPSNGPPGGPRPSTGGSGSDKPPSSAARPRGMSDASYRNPPPDGNYRGNMMNDSTNTLSTHLEQLTISTRGSSSSHTTMGSAGSSGHSTNTMSLKSPKSPSKRAIDSNDGGTYASVAPLSAPAHITSFPSPFNSFSKSSNPSPSPAAAASPLSAAPVLETPRHRVTSTPVEAGPVSYKNVPIIKEPVQRTRSLHAALHDTSSPPPLPPSPLTTNPNQPPSTNDSKQPLPVPLFLRRQLSLRRERPESIVSMSTDQELQSVAEIMGMSMQDDGSINHEHQASFGVPLEDEDAVIDDILSFEDVLRHGRVRPERFSLGSAITSTSSTNPPSMCYTSSSVSDFDHSETYSDIPLLVNNSGQPSNISVSRMPSLDSTDTPSLISSRSSYSFSSSTPSRTSSLQHYQATSPISTSSASSLVTPVDSLTGSMHELDVIQEHRNAEDMDPNSGLSITPRESQLMKLQSHREFVYFEEEDVEETPDSWVQDPSQNQVIPEEDDFLDVYSVFDQPSGSNSPDTITGETSQPSPISSHSSGSTSTPTITPQNTTTSTTRASSTAIKQEKHESHGSAFSRLFKGGKRQSTSSPTHAASAPRGLYSIASRASGSSSSEVSLVSKADEKKWKKEAAKARRERLAIDLKERQEARMAAAIEAKKNAKRTAPTEEAGMWNGLLSDLVL